MTELGCSDIDDDQSDVRDSQELIIAPVHV